MPEHDDPVQANALLMDPASMTVVWMNESAARNLPGDDDLVAVTIDRVVPMAGALGLAEAVRDVAVTGEARHLGTNVVSTVKGRMALAISIYRLPDGMVLVLTDNTWESQQRSGGAGASRRSGRRTR